MFKIDLKKVIVDLKDKPVKFEDRDMTIGDILPDIVLGYKLEGSMRKLSLAQKLANQDTIQVEQADLTLIKSAVKEAELYKSKAFETLIKGRIEEYLEELKEDKK